MRSRVSQFVIGVVLAAAMGFVSVGTIGTTLAVTAVLAEAD